jgi:hypothetical protein
MIWSSLQCFHERSDFIGQVLRTPMTATTLFWPARFYFTLQVLLPDRAGMSSGKPDNLGGLLLGKTSLAKLILRLLILCSCINLFHVKDFTQIWTDTTQII